MRGGGEEGTYREGQQRGQQQRQPNVGCWNPRDSEEDVCVGTGTSEPGSIEGDWTGTQDTDDGSQCPDRTGRSQIEGKPRMIHVQFDWNRKNC